MKKCICCKKQRRNLLRIVDDITDEDAKETLYCKKCLDIVGTLEAVSRVLNNFLLAYKRPGEIKVIWENEEK